MIDNDLLRVQQSEVRVGADKFVATTSDIESQLKSSTIGLTELRDYRKIKENLEEQQMREAAKTAPLGYVLHLLCLPVMSGILTRIVTPEMKRSEKRRKRKQPSNYRLLATKKKRKKKRQRRSQLRMESARNAKC